MNILQVVKAYVKENGWPSQEGIIVGPATCGQGGCRRKHAKAKTVRNHPKNPGKDKLGLIHFQYWRPCDRHDTFNAKPGEKW